MARLPKIEDIEDSEVREKVRRLSSADSADEHYKCNSNIAQQMIDNVEMSKSSHEINQIVSGTVNTYYVIHEEKKM